MIKLRRDHGNILFCEERPVLMLHAFDCFDYDPMASTFWLELSLEWSDTVVWWVFGKRHESILSTELKVIDFVPSRLQEELLDLGVEMGEWNPVFVTLWYR